MAANKFYTMVSWVDGTPIMDIIKADVSKNYYQLGKKVGAELKKLHLASECSSDVNWYNVFKNKSSTILKKYHNMQIEFSCSKSAESYILNNLSLKNRICNASRILRIWGDDFELDIPVFRG